MPSAMRIKYPFSIAEVFYCQSKTVPVFKGARISYRFFELQPLHRAKFSSTTRLKRADVASESTPPLHSDVSGSLSPTSEGQEPSKLAENDGNDDTEPRLPRSVQAVYLRPLKRQATYGIPCCDLQLRSYNVRNVELFSDFALRAAYYLNLPASGPIPLPRITERWTVPRGPFIHKKSQENFERITLRRLIQIQDGHSEAIEVWLAFLRKHAYYGIGMKANVWEHENIGVGKKMDASLEHFEDGLDPTMELFGRRKDSRLSGSTLEEMRDETLRKTSDGPFRNF